MIDFGVLILAHLVGDYIFQNDWMASGKTKSHYPCLVHVALYTLSFATFVGLSGATWPLWAYLALAAAHYPVDRWRLARVWMERVSGQKDFVKYMSPWSVIVVDNTYHLVTAWVIWTLVG